MIDRGRGFVNGILGRENKNSNGMVNGLVNGNGYTNGVGKVNGLTNGGKVNGLGRVNGITNGSGLVNGSGRTNGNGLTNGLMGKPNKSTQKSKKINKIVVICLAIVLLASVVLVLMRPVASQEKIQIDGEFNDWKDIEGSDWKVYENERNIYLYFTFPRLFKGNNGLADVLFIFIDVDNNTQTGYAVGEIGAEWVGMALGVNQSVGEVHGWTWQSRDKPKQYDFNGFSQDSNGIYVNATKNEVEVKITHFSLGLIEDKLYNLTMFVVYKQVNGDGHTFLTKEPNDYLPPFLSTVERDGILIDGIFDDWSDIQKVKDEPTEGNIDITATKSLLSKNVSSFYVKSKNQMMKGDIPFEFREIIEKIVPEPGQNYTPPIPKVHPPKDVVDGQDKIYIFIDEDDNKTTGEDISGLGVDYVAVVTGQWGKILETYIRDINTSKTLPNNVYAGCNGIEIEIQFEGFDFSQSKILYYMTDWLSNEDYANDNFYTRMTYGGTRGVDLDNPTGSITDMWAYMTTATITIDGNLNEAAWSSDADTYTVTAASVDYMKIYTMQDTSYVYVGVEHLTNLAEASVNFGFIYFDRAHDATAAPDADDIGQKISVAGVGTKYTGTASGWSIAAGTHTGWSCAESIPSTYQVYEFKCSIGDATTGLNTEGNFDAYGEEIGFGVHCYRSWGAVGISFLSASSPAQDNGNTPTTIVNTITVQSGTTILVAQVISKLEYTPLSVFSDLDGSLTLAYSKTNVNDPATHQYYLVNPTVGAHNITCVWNYPKVVKSMMCTLALSGTATTSPIGATAGAVEAGTYASVSITTTQDNSWILYLGGQATDSTMTEDSGQTQRWELTRDGAPANKMCGHGGTEPKATAGSESCGLTFSKGSDWNIQAIELKEPPTEHEHVFYPDNIQSTLSPNPDYSTKPDTWADLATAIPEFQDIVVPIIGIVVIFMVVRKRRKNVKI